MSKIIQTNWEQIYCVGCGEQIGHDVTLDEMITKEAEGLEATMCLDCYHRYTAERVADMIARPRKYSWD